MMDLTQFNPNMQALNTLEFRARSELSERASIVTFRELLSPYLSEVRVVTTYYELRHEKSKDSSFFGITVASEEQLQLLRSRINMVPLKDYDMVQPRLRGPGYD